MSKQDFNDLLKGFTACVLMFSLFYGFVCLLSYWKGEDRKEMYCGELYEGQRTSASITKQVFLEYTVEDGDSLGEKAAIKGWNSKTCEQYNSARGKLMEKLND